MATWLVFTEHIPELPKWIKTNNRIHHRETETTQTLPFLDVQVDRSIIIKRNAHSAIPTLHLLPPTQYQVRNSRMPGEQRNSYLLKRRQLGKGTSSFNCYISKKLITTKIQYQPTTEPQYQVHTEIWNI
jgi:hypothetical protein